MQDWKWPFVVGFAAVLAAIVFMFGLTEDQQIRNHLIGYLDSIVPFVIGAAAGGVVGGSVGFARGKGIF
ncbi:MAG: hypothetical protein P8020_21635 [Acidobacteriota bacterium]